MRSANQSYLKAAAIVALLFTGAAQAQTALTPKQNVDFSGVPSSRTHKEAAVEPATCVVGETYRNTATKKFRHCAATNTWADIITADENGNVNVGNTVSLAPGDGIADARPIIQAAIDSLTSGGAVQLTGGTYLLKSGAVKMKSGTTLRGTGRMGGAKIKVADKVQSALSTNAASGQRVVVVASGSGFVAGQDVTITDSAHTGYANADSNRIYSVVGNTITLEKNLKYAYTTANSAVLFTSYSAVLFETLNYYDGNGVPGGSDGVTDATLEDLELDGNAANNRAGNYDETQAVVNLANAHRSTIRNCYIHDGQFGPIVSSHYVDGSYDGSENLTISNNILSGAYAKDGLHFHGVKKSTASGNYIDTGATTTAYGVYCYLCADVSFVDNNIINALEGYFIPNSNSVHILGGKVINSVADGVMILQSVSGNYKNNSVIGVTISGTTTGYGIYLRDSQVSNTLVSGCTITGTAAQPISTAHTGATIVNNTLDFPNQYTALIIAGAHTSAVGNIMNSVSAANPIYDGGTNTTMSGNLVTGAGSTQPPTKVLGKLGVGTTPIESIDTAGAITWSGADAGAASSVSRATALFYNGFAIFNAFGADGSTYGRMRFQEWTANGGLSHTWLSSDGLGNVLLPGSAGCTAGSKAPLYIDENKTIVQGTCAP